MASPATGEDTFRATTTLSNVVDEASARSLFRGPVRRGLGGFVALAAIVSVAYAAHAPIGAPARAAPTPTTLETTASFDEAPSAANGPVTEPVLALQAPPVMPAMRLAPGEILAVFAARPAHAHLFLDGVPLDANPANLRRRADEKRHLLRAEAPGYATLVRTIELSRDVVNELELAPEATHAVIAPPSGSSSETRNEPRTQPAKRAPTPEDPWGI